MANIIENFNQNQLDLIIENVQAYNFNESLGDYIRMTITDESGNVTYQFYSNKDLNGNFIDTSNTSLERQIVIYTNDSNIYVKPNEILESNAVVSGNYTLQFDFMRNYFYSHFGFDNFNELSSILPKFYIHQISPTRKEIRLYGRLINNSELSFDDVFETNFQNILGWIDDRNKLNEDHQQYLYDYFISVSKGRNLQIINYAFDNITNPEQVSLIIRLNNPLPPDVTLYKKIDINKEIISTQTETILYNSDIESTFTSSPLTPDVQVYDEINVSLNDDTVQNYNELVTSSSISEINISSILSENKDVNLNVDFNHFKNHTFFGSAKEKVVNFKSKVGEIQNYLTEISTSLNLSGSYVNGRRKDLFSSIQKVENNFTPYEKFLYKDGQTQTTASAPGIGTNLVKSNPVNKENLYKKLNNYDGFNVVYHHSGSAGELVKVFDDNYFADKSPFFNHSGSVYLSFLMRADEALTGSNTNVLQWTNNNFAQGNLQIPSESLYQNRISEPDVSGSTWRRYIYQASQSYWEPMAIAGNDLGILDVYDFWDGYEGVAYNILQGTNITGSMALLDSSGQYGELLNPSILDEDNNLDTNTPRTGSVLPSGEYFKINWTAGTETTSSFITDIKVTKNNPLNSLPFSHIYNTGSIEFTNWYNGIHSSASKFDELNINSLTNNLPSFIQESNEYNDAKLFLSMWGEHFDLLKTYIDNYIKFYKREYKELNSVPNNLLPMLGENLGWEFINPYTGSLAEYFEIVSDGGYNLENVKHETWRKVLNNLMYIYKTKGTQNSINALLNSYGFPTNLFRVQEVGGSQENPIALSSNLSDEVTNLLGGIESEVGNISFKKDYHNFYSLNLNSSGSELNSSQIKLDWWTNQANGEAIEFVFKSSPSDKEQIILLNSGSGNEQIWDLRLVPSSSNTQHAKLEFRLSNVTEPTGSLTNNAVSMSTDYLDNLSNNKLWNVLLQRITSSTDAELTQSYQMLVGLQNRDKITTYKNTTLTTADSASNFNFISNGTLASHVSGNLIVGRTLSGSIGEFRVWKEALSGSRFKQHIFSKYSNVGNTLRDSNKSDIIYRFRLNENYKNNTTNVKIIDAFPNSTKDYSRYLYTNPINYSVDRITSYKFSSTDSFMNNINDNKIIIKPEEFMYKRLEKDSTSIRRLTDKNTRLKYNSNKIIFSQNPIDIIDDYIINQVSNHDISNKYAKPANRYSSSYGELDTFKDEVLKDVKIDINKNIKTHKNKLPDGLTESVKKLLPLRTEFDNVGVVIRPNILERTKIKYYKPKLMGGSPEEQSLELNILDSLIDMLDYGYVNSGSSVESPYESNEIILENELISSFSEIFESHPMNLSLVSGSFNLNNSEISNPYETNNLKASGSIYNWNMEKINPYETNNLNASGSVYNWSMNQTSVYDDTIDYPSLFNLNSNTTKVQQSTINVSSSMYNWDMKNINTHDSNEINVSGSVYNWLYEILNPYNSNVIHLTSGSDAALSLKNPKVFLTHDSNIIDVSGSLYNWEMENKSPYDSNTIDVSGSLYNWVYEIFKPHETNILNIASGSHPYDLNKNKPTLFTPKETDIKSSGSMYNWDMKNITTHQSNNISWPTEIYNMTKDYILPKISNVISLTTGSYNQIQKEYIGTNDGNVIVSGSVYNWTMNTTPIRKFNLHYSGSLYNWTMEHIAGDTYNGTTTEIRDNYGLAGSRLGHIFNNDETIYYGGGLSTPTSNEGKQIDYWWDAYGTGSGDLHFWSPMTGSDGQRNTGHYEKQILYYPIGDMEYVSCSVFYDGLVDIAGTDTRIKSRGKSPLFKKHATRHLRNTAAEIQIRDNTDLTNVKHFPNPILLIDEGKGYVYKSYRNTGTGDTEGKLDGRPIGRTHYFTTGSLQSGGVDGQEDLIYPSNHFINFPTSKVGIRHLTYDGTQWVSGSFRLVDPRGEQYDPFPSTPAYSIQVEGSSVGARRLRAERLKGKDNKKRK